MRQTQMKALEKKIDGISALQAKYPEFAKLATLTPEEIIARYPTEEDQLKLLKRLIPSWKNSYKKSKRSSQMPPLNRAKLPTTWYINNLNKVGALRLLTNQWRFFVEWLNNRKHAL